MYVAAVIFFQIVVIATSYAQDQYGLYGYGEYDDIFSSSGLYDEIGELPGYLTDTELPVSIPAALNEQFQVTCSPTHVTMVTSNDVMPKGLEFYLPQKTSKTSCLKFHKNQTTTEYDVDLTCKDVVTSTQAQSSLLYHHVALLVPAGTTDSSFTPYSSLYSVVVECELFGDIGRNRTFPVTQNYYIRPEKRIFEHRVSRGPGNTCQSLSCPYGSLCLPQNDVDGFYCYCTKGKQCNLRCPLGYYGCRRKGVQRLHCINTDWLCDGHVDCPGQDDEASCTEIWSSWSSWSKCGSRCGGEMQKRSRRCDVSFLKDPEKCKFFHNALGCGRRCTKNEQIQYQNRTCGREHCSRVLCNHHHMTIVIPREMTMTSQMIEERMTLGGDPSCRPSYNDTHVTFVTFLHKCNTESQVDRDLVIYSNEIRFSVEPDPNGLITRDLGHSYAVTCRFKRRQKVALRRKHRRKPESIEVAMMRFGSGNDTQESLLEHFASGDGEFEFKMDLYEDVSYTKPFPRSSYPLFKRLHEELFIAVHFHTVDDDLSVMIDRCAATPTASYDQSQATYTFIEDGCPVDETVKLYINDVSPRSGCFSIEAFRFSDESKRNVYFHCDVIVCDVSEDFCRPNCSKLKRERRSFRYNDFPQDEEVKRGHVTQGPIIIESADKSTESKGSITQRGIPAMKHSPPSDHAEDTTVRFIIMGLVGGVACLLIGILAGAYGSRKCRKNSNSV